jgi:hypothetical protein
MYTDDEHLENVPYFTRRRRLTPIARA